MFDRKDYTELELKIAASFIAAAVGDAMGGPVECQHAARIKKLYGNVDTMLRYEKPPGLIDLSPGYALQSTPGSVTDDTFIRLDFCHFFSENSPPWDASFLADWLLKNIQSRHWWPPALKALENVSQGIYSAAENGKHHPQGGGNGWWTPVGVLHAGYPEAAVSICMELSAIWKSPLEQQLNASIQGGLAYALGEGSDVAGLVSTMLSSCGPLARKLLARAVSVGEKARSLDELIESIYSNLLVEEEIRDANGPIPKILQPIDYSDEVYTSVMLAEQVAIEVASLVFSKGELESISNTVMIGRDCDSTATTVGSWVGALHGIEIIPEDWIEMIRNANINEFDLFEEIDGLIQTRRKLTKTTPAPEAT